MIHGITIEICAGSLRDVLTASAFSEVDRIELNSSLELGGITPSLATLIQAKKQSNKKIIAMVRPRPAGFQYNEIEKRTMLEDAQIFLEHGADGIVFGCLNADHTIDEDYTKTMCQLIHSFGKEAVFHKAFDLVSSPQEALSILKKIHVDRVLTSGGQPDVLSGSHAIQILQANANQKIAILPGGGVNEENAVKVLKRTGCHEIHMSAKSSFLDDGAYYAVDSKRIQKILNAIAEEYKAHYKNPMSGEDIAMFQNDSYEEKMLGSFLDEDDYDRQ